MSRLEIHPGGVVTCQQTREALSDYLEGGLDPPDHAALAAHIEQCAGCTREARELSALLSLIHERVPPLEPAVDLWAEMQPKIQHVLAEERLTVLGRLRLRGERLMNNVAMGMILFTQVLAINTQSHMQKYLLADPFRGAAEDEAG
ncbi:MAG TPA: zf-HC2 domain-containing protein [Armatimonadaceae bacterium]|nr:zf-HC2 domain-containing protein [Armatimonadaceae bacterium]